MIHVYCVFLVGEPLLLDSDSEEFGFYRNEYVASLSEERAIARAKTKTMKRLEKRGARFVDGRPFALNVERVEPRVPISRLFRSEGFIFFPVSS